MFLALALRSTWPWGSLATWLTLAPTKSTVEALGQAASSQGTANAIPFLAGANILNQGAQLGTFAATGGFGGGGAAPAGAAPTQTPFRPNASQGYIS